MGCVGTDGEDGLRPANGSSARIKSPKMFFDDCNTVYHASVPRKLRSAIRRRSCESISSPLRLSKKLKHVADRALPGKNGSSKSNLNKEQVEAETCVKDGTLGLITKDEEEVAEALYALAVVFPDATKTNKSKLIGKQSGAPPSASPKPENSITRFRETKIQKTQVEPKTARHKDDKPICLSNVLGSTTEEVFHTLNSTKQPDISIGKQLPMESGCDIPAVNLPLTDFISENECTIQRPSCESVVSSAWTELSVEHVSKLLKPEKSLANCNYPENAFELSGAASGQPAVKCIKKENRDTGLSLWPGLSSRMSCDHEGAKHSAWFKSSTSIARAPISNSVIVNKNAQVDIDSKKSWKRCSTHVYISHFIKAFQITDGRDRSLVQSSQIITNERPKQGLHDTSSGPGGVRNGLIEIISTKGNGCSMPEKDAIEVRNAILLHKRLVQDQQQGSTTSGIYNAQKQSLDFLSLPTGNGVENINSTNRAGPVPEALSPLPFPCFQSQYQPAVPFPLSQNYYLSTYFSGYPSAAAFQQVHLPAFVGSMPPTAGASTSSPSQPEQRQQQKRAPLLMANYKSGVASPNILNWQSGTSELSPVFHHAQILFPPSRSSVEAIGSKYAPIIQQQQQQQQSISATVLMPPSTVISSSAFYV